MIYVCSECLVPYKDRKPQCSCRRDYMIFMWLPFLVVCAAFMVLVATSITKLFKG